MEHDIDNLYPVDADTLESEDFINFESGEIIEDLTRVCRHHHLAVEQS